ncbi:hypothetical protein [Paenibacillus foliorum]|uniref:hypothetical protein n=1 Tax=Paenibacillus foliorum TaxID=2654974 RepID=UPI001C125D37|nr:hypothetical protein [Paenibacillus foliorum]
MAYSVFGAVRFFWRFRAVTSQHGINTKSLRMFTAKLTSKRAFVFLNGFGQ